MFPFEFLIRRRRLKGLSWQHLTFFQVTSGLLLAGGCNQENKTAKPRIHLVGNAAYNFGNIEDITAIYDDGAKKPHYVRYLTGNFGDPNRLMLIYEKRGSDRGRKKARDLGLPFINNANFQIMPWNVRRLFYVHQPWGISICDKEVVKVGLLYHCATSFYYHDAEWSVKFNYSSLLKHENVKQRAIDALADKIVLTDGR